MDKDPVESITRDEAKLRHPDRELEIRSILDHKGEERLALFVFDKDDRSSERVPLAVYWLDRGH